MAHKSDAELVQYTHNTSRFFVAHPPIAWDLLIGTVLWGWYGNHSMPQRKDPDIPVRQAVATTPWPGVGADEVEQQVTRAVEEKIGENPFIHPSTPADYGIRSVSMPGLSIVYVQLDESVNDTKKQFNDINLKLNELSNHLPQGAGPIQFQSDFGDTAALMLTVVSPRLDDVEIAVRSRAIEKVIEKARTAKHADNKDPGVTALYCYPANLSVDVIQRVFVQFAQLAQKDGIFRQAKVISGSGCIGVDGASSQSNAQISRYIATFIQTHLQASEFHPDSWGPVFVRDVKETEQQLSAAAGDKYSYRELDDFTDLLARTLIGTPQASKYQRSGVVPEQIYLDYSQERLARYGLEPSKPQSLLPRRNITMPGGGIEAGTKNVIIDPSGAFTSAKAIGDVIVGSSTNGSPIYLRDLVDIGRAYQSPLRFLNFYSARDKN